MALIDPVVVYNARTNSEALMLKVMLVEMGIEAFASEDLSPAGMWMFGTLPVIHKPQVWVSRVDFGRATAAIEGYEDELAERNRADKAGDSESQEPILVECDECHRTSEFPASQRGTIGDCSHCGAFVDVGEVDDEGMPWDEEE